VKRRRFSGPAGDHTVVVEALPGEVQVRHWGADTTISIPIPTEWGATAIVEVSAVDSLNAAIDSLSATAQNGAVSIDVSASRGGRDIAFFRVRALAPLAAMQVVEFYNAQFDHYFISADPNEIAVLDEGTRIKGWVRTGNSFNAYPAGAAGKSPVCRFYMPPPYGDSHFFGRGTAECDATRDRNPGFVYESSEVMAMALPVAGTCPAGTRSLYRVFSSRPDANHRYTADRAVRDQMVGKGWLAEGDGPDAVVMCGPS